MPLCPPPVYNLESFPPILNWTWMGLHPFPIVYVKIYYRKWIYVEFFDSTDQRFFNLSSPYYFNLYLCVKINNNNNNILRRWMFSGTLTPRHSRPRSWVNCWRCCRTWRRYRTSWYRSQHCVYSHGSKHTQTYFNGTVVLILPDTPFIEWHDRFTTLHKSSSTFKRKHN